MFIHCIENVVLKKLKIISNFTSSRHISMIFANNLTADSCLSKNFIFSSKITNDTTNFVTQRYLVSQIKHSPNFKNVQKCILSRQFKKRPQRDKKQFSDDNDASQSGFFSVKALATAEEYNLEFLKKGLAQQNLYLPKAINTSGKAVPDVIYTISKYEVEAEPREMYFFRNGTVVMWNIPELETGNILKFLRIYEEDSYNSFLIQEESEVIPYTYCDSGKQSHLKDGNIYLAPDGATLDKYTFSNAISQSIKLGIWEASLDNYIESIEFITEDLKAGKKIKMSRQEVLRKQGELFALRHLINLSSDLLDTPDFYWERDDLETLYQQTCGYFSITKRTRIMNEKINHCVELVELLSSHLSDRHHVRLEWMIIILILVEVCFELVHYLDRYLEKEEDIDIANSVNT